jgi:hypothetical protein
MQIGEKNMADDSNVKPSLLPILAAIVGTASGIALSGNMAHAMSIDDHGRVIIQDMAIGSILPADIKLPEPNATACNESQCHVD